MVWDPNRIKLQVVEKATQHIHGMLQMQKGMIIHITTVYGLHSISVRGQLWEDIKRLSSQTNGPSLIMGDFNSILSTEDRLVGIQVQMGEMKDFKECVNQCNLSKMSIVGRNFTWTNGHIYSRIDKVLINNEWMISMPPEQVKVMDPLFSNHSPLSIDINEQKNSTKRSFRFYNCLA